MTSNPRIKCLAAILAIVVWPVSCSPVPQAPQAATKFGNLSVTPPASPASMAEINRGIAAAAQLQSSNTHTSADYRVGPEDLIEFTLFNVPEADGKVTPRTVIARVSQEGFVSLPLLGEQSVKGLTIPLIERKLRGEYDQYIYNPQIGVFIKEFRQRVSIIGAVQKPGIVELTGPKTLTEILAMAGGVGEKAGSQVHVYRQGSNGRESHVIDLSVLASNASLINAENVGLIAMPVQAGDVINVPPAGTFFVDGAVKKPGPYPLGRNYSLSQALATAGGVDPELNSSDITIFRRKGSSGIEAMSFDHNAILAGSIVDPQIEPDDVIVVPMSTTKYLVKRFVGSLVGGISIQSLISGS